MSKRFLVTITKVAEVEVDLWMALKAIDDKGWMGADEMLSAEEIVERYVSCIDESNLCFETLVSCVSELFPAPQGGLL